MRGGRGFAGGRGGGRDGGRGGGRGFGGRGRGGGGFDEGPPAEICGKLLKFVYVMESIKTCLL